MNIKYLHSLKLPKFRDANNVFIAEGIKTVSDIMSLGYFPEEMYYCEGNKQLSSDIISHGVQISSSIMSRISTLKTPQQVLAVFNKFHSNPVASVFHSKIDKEHIIFLDNISDPGNLGTIIRSADWFGCDTIVCSQNTVDMYNPKAIQASMGAIANVHIYYEDTEKFLRTAKDNSFSIIGTFMEGTNVNDFTFPEKSIIIIGNEANGITQAAKPLIDTCINIASCNPKHKVSESLNAAISAAIILFKSSC